MEQLSLLDAAPPSKNGTAAASPPGYSPVEWVDCITMEMGRFQTAAWEANRPIGGRQIPYRELAISDAKRRALECRARACRIVDLSGNEVWRGSVT